MSLGDKNIITLQRPIFMYFVMMDEDYAIKSFNDMDYVLLNLYFIVLVNLVFVVINNSCSTVKMSS